MAKSIWHGHAFF